MPITIMSKAYLLVICLLAASFTGCLADDEIEEQKITPVGTDDGSDDEDYDELVSEIANLTEQIEELNSQIDVLSEDLQSLESYRYNPPENSSYSVITYQCSLGYDDRNVSTGINEYCSFAPAYDIIKNGNTITVNYKGMWLSEDILFNSTTNCSNNLPQIEFFNVDGVKIYEFMSIYSTSSAFVERQTEGCSYTEEYIDSNGYHAYGKVSLWNSLVFSLPEETARVNIEGGLEGYAAGAYFTFA